MLSRRRLTRRSVHELYDARQHIGIGVGQYAMAEVEDVTLGLGAGIEHVARALLDHRPGGEDGRRVEVALNGLSRADALRGDIERYAPVDADDIGNRHQAK